jgi:hypothetical protein
MRKMIVPKGTKGRVMSYNDKGFCDFKPRFELDKDMKFELQINANGFLLVDPPRVELYKRADKHPMYNKLGPWAGEMLSIAMKNGRHSLSTFLYYDTKAKVVNLLSVPTAQVQTIEE